MTNSMEVLQDECLELLTQKLRAAEAERDEHRAIADRAESLCKPIRRAITELQKARGKPTARRSARPCAGKQEIFDLARDAVREAGGMSLESVMRSVASSLKARGRNRSMSAKLLSECLKSDAFVVTDEGRVELAGAAAPPAPSPRIRTETASEGANR